MTEKNLLEVIDLKVEFNTDEGRVLPVDGVSFSLNDGETTAIVGESGCGKSLTALSIMGLIDKPGRIVGGKILFEGKDLLCLSKHERHAMRGKELAMIFQEPMSSLNPVFTVGYQIAESILLHQNVDQKEAKKRSIELLKRTGIPRAEKVFDSYPHSLSGGMCQRAMIAIALSCNPKLLIADEPTTALDVTTEAQILDLMRSLQRELGMAMLYITHNLGVIAEIAEKVIVMYLGTVVEQADVRTLFAEPKHPYTQALLHSIPRIGRKSRRRLDAIKGMVPDPLNVPTGCRFHDRCIQFMPGVCDRAEPQMLSVGTDHLARCFLYGQSGG